MEKSSLSCPEQPHLTATGTLHSGSTVSRAQVKYFKIHLLTTRGFFTSQDETTQLVPAASALSVQISNAAEIINRRREHLL